MGKKFDGQGEGSGSQLPMFFKVLVRDFHTSLRLPQKFVEETSWRSTGMTVIMGPSGRVWNVEYMKKHDGEVHLQRGWRAFVREHSLEEHDFLLFKYYGNMHFKVKVFGKTSCEKETRPSIGNVEEDYKYQRKPLLKRIISSYSVKQSAYLHIPYSFAKHYLPPESTELTLIGPDGEDWKVKYVVVNSRTILTGGWISFARYYGLKVDDTCFFEVVSPLQMKVHIK